MSDEVINTWSDDDANRITRVVRQVERRVRPGAGGRTPPDLQPDVKKFFYTTSTITARTGTSPPFTPGSGTATMLEWNSSMQLVSTSISVTLRHGGVNAIASGRLVQAGLVDGEWSLDVDYC